jgi:hypothetical protein
MHNRRGYIGRLRNASFSPQRRRTAKSVSLGYKHSLMLKSSHDATRFLRSPMRSCRSGSRVSRRYTTTWIKSARWQGTDDSISFTELSLTQHREIRALRGHLRRLGYEVPEQSYALTAATSNDGQIDMRDSRLSVPTLRDQSYEEHRPYGEQGVTLSEEHISRAAGLQNHVQESSSLARKRKRELVDDSEGRSQHHRGPSRDLMPPPLHPPRSRRISQSPFPKGNQTMRGMLHEPMIDSHPRPDPIYDANGQPTSAMFSNAPDLPNSNPRNTRAQEVPERMNSQNRGSILLRDAPWHERAELPSSSGTQPPHVRAPSFARLSLHSPKHSVSQNARLNYDSFGHDMNGRRQRDQYTLGANHYSFAAQTPPHQQSYAAPGRQMAPPATPKVQRETKYSALTTASPFFRRRSTQRPIETRRPPSRGIQFRRPVVDAATTSNLGHRVNSDYAQRSRGMTEGDPNTSYAFGQPSKNYEDQSPFLRRNNARPEFPNARVGSRPPNATPAPQAFLQYPHSSYDVPMSRAPSMQPEQHNSRMTLPPSKQPAMRSGAREDPELSHILGVRGVQSATNRAHFQRPGLVGSRDLFSASSARRSVRR